MSSDSNQILLNDQQISINRLITLLDFMIGSSAKGVLLFPEELLPEGYTMDDISDESVEDTRPKRQKRGNRALMRTTARTGLARPNK